MTPAQQQIAELLRDLKRPADVIAANAELPLSDVKSWLRSGRWPAINRQRTLFEMAGGNSPRESTKPTTAPKGNHGLSLFSNPAGRPVTMSHPGRSNVDE